MKQQRILLIIGGGIAAYKCLDLVRRLRERGASVRAVMTRAAAEFVTPLSVAALTNERVFTELFDLNDEHEIGHIRLSREADLIVVAPATADLLAKMAGGHANDLATAVLLATDKPVLAAPAMNPRMWLNPATQRNVALLQADGIRFVGPNTGEMAERGEAGPGRLAEVPEIIAAARAILSEGGARSVTRLRAKAPLAGRHVLVTSGPTHEPIDPVRYIANRSSGKQGHAVAAAAARLGARVTLISGPVALADPAGVETVSRRDRRGDACRRGAQPARRHRRVCRCRRRLAHGRVAARQDQEDRREARARSRGKSRHPRHDRQVERPATARSSSALQPRRATSPPTPARSARPRVPTGLSPTTCRLRKRACSAATSNTVHLVTADGIEDWPTLPKEDVAERLMLRAAEFLRRSTAAAE